MGTCIDGSSIYIMRSLWLIVLLLGLSSTAEARMLRKVHATIPYAIEGSNTVIGADGTTGKYGLGGQVVFHHRLLKDR
jgi:hypothetical protein